ncbi:hypothetical protein FBU59_006237, partial [Linderina macrospora]
MTATTDLVAPVPLPRKGPDQLNQSGTEAMANGLSMADIQELFANADKEEQPRLYAAGLMAER